jgi:hypothetical protein
MRTVAKSKLCSIRWCCLLKGMARPRASFRGLAYWGLSLAYPIRYGSIVDYVPCAFRLASTM